MLACMLAGFALCNLLGKRSEIHGLLGSTLPPLLAFFFFSAGNGYGCNHHMRV